MDKVTLDLNYTEDEVVSAQRMRFLHTSRPKIIVVIGVVGVILLTVGNVYLGRIEGRAPRWYAPIEAAVILLGFVGFSYFYVPKFDFRNNLVWKSHYKLTLAHNGMGLVAEGKSKRFELEWSRINRVLENDKAFVVQFGREKDYIILPRRVLEMGGQLDFVRQVLQGNNSLTWKTANTQPRH